MKAKFFSAIPTGPVWSRIDACRDLEVQVNAWLTGNPTIRIFTVQQSAAGGSLNPPSYLVSVWYEEAEQMDERAPE
jgi:hypothetical protein